MVKFNWKRVLRISEYKPKKIYEIFKFLVVKKDIPEKKYTLNHRYYHVDFSGSSFLLYPETLLFYAYKHSYRDIALYLHLAAMRPWAHYEMFRKTTINVREIGLDLDNLLEDKTLCPVDDAGNIHFLYERPLTKDEKLT